MLVYRFRKTTFVSTDILMSTFGKQVAWKRPVAARESVQKNCMAGVDMSQIQGALYTRGFRAKHSRGV